jgi:hypothetical protein
MARSLNVIHDLVKSDNALYVNYYKQVRSGARIPEQNAWDAGRTAADSTVSPYYFEELNLGALTLDGRGVASFGPYSIVFQDRTIERRSTVFEENPFEFCRRHRISAGQQAPLGYRAIWDERGKLAMAKLHMRLKRGMQPAEFPGILLRNRLTSVEEDFIEVHIYGPIHRSAIERVIGPKPSRGAELYVWRSVEASLKRQGAKLEAI